MNHNDAIGIAAHYRKTGTYPSYKAFGNIQITIDNYDPPRMCLVTDGPRTFTVCKSQMDKFDDEIFEIKHPAKQIRKTVLRPLTI